MRCVGLAMIGLLAMAGGVVRAEGTTRPMDRAQQINQECSQQQDVADCIMKATHHYTGVLQEVFDKLAAVASRRDETVLSLLKDSQKSWDAFRREACIFQAMTLHPNDAVGGKPEMASCMLYITIDRLANLQYIASQSK